MIVSLQFLPNVPFFKTKIVNKLYCKDKNVRTFQKIMKTNQKILTFIDKPCI